MVGCLAPGPFQMGMVNYEFLFTALDGRIGRFWFWIGTIVLTMVNAAAIGAIVLLLGVSQTSLMLSVFVSIVLAYPTYALMAKRFQDRNRPGWLAFFPLAAFYGTNMAESAGLLQAEPPNAPYMLSGLLALGMSLWVLIDLGILKGTQGPNRYGHDPLGVEKEDAAL